MQQMPRLLGGCQGKDVKRLGAGLELFWLRVYKLNSRYDLNPQNVGNIMAHHPITGQYSAYC